MCSLLSFSVYAVMQDGTAKVMKINRIHSPLISRWLKADDSANAAASPLSLSVFLFSSSVYRFSFFFFFCSC